MCNRELLPAIEAVLRGDDFASTGFAKGGGTSFPCVKLQSCERLGGGRIVLRHLVQFVSGNFKFGEATVQADQKLWKDPHYRFIQTI